VDKAQRHEETIVPVKPALRASAAGAGQSAAASSGRGSRWLTGALLGLLVVAAVGVFVLLPKWVAGPVDWTPPAVPVEPQQAAEPAAPVLSTAELAALKDQAETLLARLLTQQQRLERQSVSSWGGETHQRYAERARAGDDAYLAEAFGTAVSAYEEALQLGEELLQRGGQMLESALAAGRAAYEAGNAALAVQQFDIVLTIDPEHVQAAEERARAERLPRVLELVAHGDAAQAEGDFAAAERHYREALAIEPTWSPAQRALSALSANAAAAAYEREISTGLAALAAEEYDVAIERFTAALALRGDSREAREGLAQAEEGLKLDRIALAEARALAFERRELWEQAVAQYRAALDTDPTLTFAIEGLERAQARAGLDAKLTNLIEKPNLLFTDAVLADARALVAEARAVPEPGPRLTEQIDKLERLITLATTPVTVELRSDGLTQVTLFRVGVLGVFAGSKHVELRPGTYTAVGSRNGYRDVRRTFTVLPGRPLEPVEVVCAEPI
jgi:tetratricopeptide (TPR) repeat protein